MSEPAAKIISLETPHAHNNSKKIIVVGLILGLFAVCGLSYYWFVYLERYISTDDAYVESNLFPISTKVPGAIKSIYFDEGQKVKKGDMLLEIDSVDLDFEKNFKNLKVQKATLDFKRAETLHGSNAISDFDYENAEANLKAAQVDLEGTQLKIGYTKIYSPTDGVIAKKSVQVGQIIQPGQSLFIVVDDQKNWIKANLKETQIENLKVGQNVEVFVDGFRQRKIRGKIESIFPSSGSKLSLLPAENSTGNFTRVVQRIPVKIQLNSSDLTNISLRPGMSAEIVVDTKAPVQLEAISQASHE